jgi:ABC-type antimicrobial peptide transport system permease subunit
MSGWMLRRVERRLERVVPHHARASVIGDLVEEYRLQQRSRGRLRAAIWLSSEARSLQRSYRGGRRGAMVAVRRAAMDWRIVSRALRRRPGFTLAATIMLSVGVGAAAASWSIFDAVLLRPLPYPAADRLVYLSCLLPGENEPGASMSFRDARDVAERAKTLDGVAAFWDTPALQTRTPSGPTAVFANFVQGRYFEILGARPVRGRLIGPGDDTAPGQNPVVVISEQFWRDRLGANDATVGSTLTLNGRPFTVIGVMAAGFRDVPFENGEQPSGGHPLDVWLPGSMLEVGYNAAAASARNARLGNAIGRLKPGATVEQAREELGALAQSLGREFPSTNQRIGFWADPLVQHLYKPIRRTLGVVLTASIALLLIGALNVGGLLLVRQQERRRELVVRRALGASRAELIGSSAAESAMLVLLAALPAIPLAAGILAAVRRTAPFPVPEKDAGRPDPDRIMVWRHNITPGALAAVGIPLVRGREFLATDAATRPFVVVISETMARRFWGDADPIGQRFTIVTAVTPRPWFTVIGVAKDASHRGRLNMLSIPQLDIYQLLDQRAERALTLVVRSAGSPDSVIPGIRDVMRRIDPELALRNITTLDDHLHAEGAGLRFASMLLAAYAGLAFLLAAFGVYALISYVVTIRAREWAMRQVLGATPSELFRRLVSGGAGMAATGVAIGLVMAWWSAALLQSVLFGVSARNGAAYAAAGLVVMAVTVLAAAIPARRVSRIEPARALQSE